MFVTVRTDIDGNIISIHADSQKDLKFVLNSSEFAENPCSANFEAFMNYMRRHIDYMVEMHSVESNDEKMYLLVT